ncbi:hypothetical protein N7471_010172 [Penicillium samsonianum]|uniref:uncharacterized protein n=1 Tax=Penicillium samsonianum TaxID=1882272 RepID=UPI00254852C3|nr:uncharacterized protein N7471_010172 [Penicillium samsonianum]KAJ6128955.1 hypothetical protein N7471_010172 [Penicillium samsonianum]
MADAQATAGAGGDRPPLGPGQVGPNHARNVAKKRRRRERREAQNAAIEQRRREIRAGITRHYINLQVEEALTNEFGPAALRGGRTYARGGSRGGRGRGGARGGRGRGGGRGAFHGAPANPVHHGAAPVIPGGPVTPAVGPAPAVVGPVMPIVGPVAPVVGPAAPALDNAPAAVSPDVPAVGHADMAADILGAANPAAPVFKYEEDIDLNAQ